MSHLQVQMWDTNVQRRNTCGYKSNGALHIELGLARVDAILGQSGAQVIHCERCLRLFLQRITTVVSKASFLKRQGQRSPLPTQARMAGWHESGPQPRSPVYGHVDMRPRQYLTQISALQVTGAACYITCEEPYTVFG